MLRHYPTFCTTIVDAPGLTVNLGSPADLQQSLSRLDVGASICAALGGECAVCGPEINQRLHWVQLMRLQHLQRHSSEDKVREAAVELFLQAQVVEGFAEVGPVQVSVDAEHLAEDGLANFNELGRESGRLADPVRTRQGGDGEGRGGWWGGDGSPGIR